MFKSRPKNHRDFFFSGFNLVSTQLMRKAITITEEVNLYIASLDYQEKISTNITLLTAISTEIEKFNSPRGIERHI